MLRFVCLCAVLASCVLASVELEVMSLGLPSLGSYNVNASQISVSGISAGGFMAVQFHVAFSTEIMGAGVIAGGPFWCAKASLITAEEDCMTMPELINVQNLVGYTQEAANTGSIDSPKDIMGDKVYMYSGLRDTVVHQGVMVKLQEYYSNYVAENDSVTVFNISSEHAIITNSYGNDCAYLGTPYINNCDYDQAFEIFDFIYGGINEASNDGNATNLIEFDQTEFFEDHLLVSMNSKGYVYVPTACQSKSIACKLHVAFHGCEQSETNIGDTFVTHAGYNGHAELNNIIVLYPQTTISDMNPKACFDWWGYTSRAYATKIGPQMVGIQKMIARLQGQ